MCGYPHTKSIFNPSKSYPDSIVPATAAREALQKPLAELTQRLRAGKYQALPRLGMNAVLGYAIKGLMIEVRPMKPRKPTVVVTLGKKKLGSAKAWAAASVLPGWDVSPEASTAEVVRGKPDSTKVDSTKSNGPAAVFQRGPGDDLDDNDATRRMERDGLEVGSPLPD